jgi:hypothetical protein
MKIQLASLCFLLHRNTAYSGCATQRNIEADRCRWNIIECCRYGQRIVWNMW